MVHVIKVYLEDANNEKQIRRLAVGSGVVSSFDLLKERVRDLFQLQNKNFQLKWKDSENDFILMSSDGELAQALANVDDGLLKLFAFVSNSEPTKVQSEPETAPKVHGELHPLVICDGCEQNVFGDRFKCLQCKNYDLCSSCNKANKHPYHDMIKLVKPVNIPRDWVYLGARRMWRSMFGRCPSSYFPTCMAQNKAPGSSSSSEDSQNRTPGSRAQQNAFTSFLNGDFVSAQKLVSEGLCTFLQNWPGGIDVKIENSPFQPGCNIKKQEDEANLNKEEKEDKFKAAQSVPSDNTSMKDGKKEAEKVEAEVEYRVSTAQTDEIPQIISVKDGKTAAEKVETEAEYQVSTAQTQEIPQTRGLFTANLKPFPMVDQTEYVTSVSEKPSDIEVRETSPVIDQTECVTTVNGKPSDSEVRETSPVDDPESSTGADGWTFLQEEEANKSESSATGVEGKVTEAVSMYPNLEKSEAVKQNASLEQGKKNTVDGNVIQTNDPTIINALIKMQAMGFTNEGGWLERLLITKKGNINEALDALYPFSQRQ